MVTKVGIIGAGGMLRFHVEGFRAAGAEVVAVADIRPEAGRRAREVFGIPEVYESAEAMLAGRPDLDAVSVITPNRFHAELSILALAAGKHVFCEKPPALNAEEVRRMREAEAASGRLLMFNFNNRARPSAVALAERLRSGDGGVVHSAQARWVRRAGIPGFGGWFTDRAQAGGGALIDLLHMVDLAWHFMGHPEPAHVLAQTFSDFIHDAQFKGPWGIPDGGGPTNVENAAHGFIRFATGQVMSFQISWAEMVAREEVSVTFQGSRAGGLMRRWFAIDGDDNGAMDTCEWYEQVDGRAVNSPVVTGPDETMGRRRSAENFIRSLRGEETPFNTSAQAFQLMRVIDAIYESARTGAPVSLSPIAATEWVDGRAGLPEANGGTVRARNGRPLVASQPLAG